MPASATERFRVALHLPVAAERVTLTAMRLTSGPAAAPPSGEASTSNAPMHEAEPVGETHEAGEAEVRLRLARRRRRWSPPGVEPEVVEAAASPAPAVEQAVEVTAAAEAAPVATAELPAVMTVPAFAMPAPLPRTFHAHWVGFIVPVTGDWLCPTCRPHPSVPAHQRPTQARPAVGRRNRRDGRLTPER